MYLSLARSRSTCILSALALKCIPYSVRILEGQDRTALFILSHTYYYVDTKKLIIRWKKKFTNERMCTDLTNTIFIGSFADMHRLRHTHVPRQSKSTINSFFKAYCAQGLPSHPELECIWSPATLDRLVSCVIADIIEFILLEEVRCLGRVAFLKKILLRKEVKK